MPRQFKNHNGNYKKGCKTKTISKNHSGKKTRFTLFNEQHESTGKIYTGPGNKPLDYVALKVAKKAWADNKNLQIIYLVHNDSGEEFQYKATSWTHSHKNKFR